MRSHGSSEWPVISFGCSRPISSRMVGATSASCPLASFLLEGRAVHQDERHLFKVCAVCGSPVRIDHLLGIAIDRVISSTPFGFPASRKRPRHLSIASTAFSQRPRMPLADHVAVGEIDDNQVKLIGLDRRRRACRSPRRRTFPAAGHRSRPWARAPECASSPGRATLRRR